MNLICFEFGVMISIWVLLRFWYDFDTILIWFWYGFDMVPVSWLQTKKQKQPRDRFLVKFSSVFMVSVWFWYGFDTISIRFWYDFDTFLIWFWYGFDMVPVSWLQKKNRNSPGTGFWSMFRRFLWFWFDFDTILIWVWYDFFWIFFRYGSDGLASNHKFDPHQKT